MTIKTKVAAATAAVATSLMLSSAAFAAPITFFGENTNPGGAVSGDPATAEANFLATLTGVSTEDFEGLADGANEPSLTFNGTAGDITANLTGQGEVEDDAGAGRFATSGSKFYETGGGGDFSISFSTAISAFGFYATDLGDFNNSLTLVLTREGGGTENLAVGNTVGAPDGSLLFFGFIDTMNSYTNISFLNEPGGTDIFGFDDMTIGERGQITNPPDVVPLPAGGVLLLTGMGAVAALRRRKKA